MDILSLGKASKALRTINDLDKNVVGTGAETHFLSVDARLDWLESQASKSKATTDYNVDLSQPRHSGTKYVTDHIELKRAGGTDANPRYVSTGTWESEVIDLGQGLLKMISMTVSAE